jgi:hypothetical protein
MNRVLVLCQRKTGKFCFDVRFHRTNQSAADKQPLGKS